MSQCLRCSKLCETSAVFCDDCRSLLRNEFRRGSASRSSDADNATPMSAPSWELASFPTSPLSASAPSLVAQKQERPRDGLGDGLADQDTMQSAIAETPRVSYAPITPHPPTMNSYTYPDSPDQTISRLSEAAQFIAEVDPANRRLPRASRLAPMRDISADIRRESTPMPRFAKMRGNTDASEKAGASASGSLPTRPGNAPERGRLEDGDLPDLWPWLDGEVEEKENEDSWANSTDPLISRHIPNSAEAARIEEEDIRRALAEGMPTSHNLRLFRARRPFSLRMAFVVLALLAVIALIVDSVLLSVVVNHPRRAATSPNGPAVAALTLSPNMAKVYDEFKKRAVQVRVVVSIMNFPPHHEVQLTHDVQEAVMTTSNSSILTIREDGSAKATILVDDTWAVGFDQVYAEDVTTHYTASAQLQVVGKDSSSPAHLGLYDQTGKQQIKSLDFGSVYQGLNSIQHLMLENDGSGSITWSAGSDRPWLLVSPNQGTFSQNQKIDVAVQTLSLNPGMYTGALTLSSNVSAQPLLFRVTLKVLKPGAGALLAITPAVLSFTTTDGSQAPLTQILTLNNPGTQPLNWTLAISASIAASNQSSLAHVSGISNKWLSANLDTGSVPAHSSQQIAVSVNSSSLLPGAYQGELSFSAPGAIDKTQVVSVSLTVQPHCGLVTNSGYLTFTAVQGTTSPSNQSLGLNATASCAGAPLNWKATLSSSFNWLNATPTSGVLKGTTSEFISVGANAAGLPARTYYGFIAFTTANSTQTVMAQLRVQPPPSPGAPIMSATPLNLNFSNTLGQPNPPGQVVTITNTGGSQLNWSTNVVPIATCWFCVSPSGGTIPKNSTGQLVVNINTSRLTSPGAYAGQIIINATDSNGKPASGSGQIVSVNLVVQPSCTLTQPSSTSLAFSGVQGGANPVASTLLITGTGNCAWPLTLTPSKTSASWLSVNFPTGFQIKGNGQSVPFVVAASTAGLPSGPPLSASFTISATDSAGTIAFGSPQQVTATLSVLPPPCVAAPVTNLAFMANQGQASPAPQMVPLSESGTCSRPVTWTATTANPWLSLSTPAPDTGSGTSVTVGVNSTTLPAGTVTGTFVLTATDKSGATVGSQTVTVTLTVAPTYTVSGTVLACQPGPAPTCTTSSPLPGASLTLFDSTNMLIETAKADPSGNYTFINLPPGIYSVTITGTDANNVPYSSTDSLPPVTTNATGITLQVYPG